MDLFEVQSVIWPLLGAGFLMLNGKVSTWGQTADAVCFSIELSGHANTTEFHLLLLK
jgi:hypothetical protein